MKILEIDYFKEVLQKAEPNYDSDIAWHYILKGQNYQIVFGQDDIGRNSIDEFSVLLRKKWVTILPTDEQIKLMFEKLDKTPYREDDFVSEPISDEYDCNGVNRLNFY